MTCAATQSTLLHATSETARPLGLVRLAAWHALELATVKAAPVSTSPTLTRVLLQELEEAGVLDTADSGGDIRRSLYDPISWRYRTPCGPTNQLLPEIRAKLLAAAADPASYRLKLALWEALADAEIESYLGHLLRRHGLESISAETILETLRDEWAVHSLARRRYLLWYGIRGAATGLLKSGMDYQVAAQSMVDEIRRRSRWLGSRRASDPVAKAEYAFFPDPSWKRPTLLETFLELVMPIGQDYWMETPRDYQDRLRASSPGASER